MGTKVFISWSGERSQAVAEGLRDFLPRVLQRVEPWLSSRDIGSGQEWLGTLRPTLDESNYGILCLVPENLGSHWLLYEAGALSKSVDQGAIVPYLYALEPTQLGWPLAAFQARRANRQETLRLVRDLNARLEEPCDEAIVADSFNAFWDPFEERLSAIPDRDNLQEDDDVPGPNPTEAITEILAAVRESRSPLVDDFVHDPKNRRALRALQRDLRNSGVPAQVTLDEEEFFVHLPGEGSIGLTLSDLHDGMTAEYVVRAFDSAKKHRARMATRQDSRKE